MSANERQVGGDHYKGGACPHCGESIEHWDLIEIFDLDPYQYSVTKYVLRHKRKAGVQDLEKALHHLEKYIEVVRRREARRQGVKAGLTRGEDDSGNTT